MKIHVCYIYTVYIYIYIYTRVVQKVLPLAKTKQYLQMCFILTVCTVRINNITKNSSQVPCVITKIMIY